MCRPAALSRNRTLQGSSLLSHLVLCGRNCYCPPTSIFLLFFLIKKKSQILLNFWQPQIKTVSQCPLKLGKTMWLTSGQQAKVRRSKQAFGNVWTAGVVLSFPSLSNHWLDYGPSRCGDVSFQPFTWQQHSREWQKRNGVTISSPSLLMLGLLHKEFITFCYFLMYSFPPAAAPIC